jgi:uncharacterized protein (DUF849 family)
MLLQAALNGDRTRDDHPAIPLTADELARDAAACVAAGAGAFHIHPRDEDGRETLDAAVVDAVVVQVQAAAGGAPVGVSTAAWIEPDLEARLAAIARWRAPDYASVNLSEDGFADVMRVLLENGIGIEAGLWSVQDADRLVACGLADRVTRVLVEPMHPDAIAAPLLYEAIHARLDTHGIQAPRLQHGDGEATWPILDDALATGYDSRIGFEDTLLLPDGERAPDNAALVSAAARLLGR